ncbi:MAG: bifunctional oligoribonuclease/PAP phosphatase NrnA [Bdellovibrionales bacterium]|nr:bifunctional oligoribonuclease/PAP phosphatase NrnA [Bdellovibrionales bacterium]
MPRTQTQLTQLISKIQSARNIILTTHKTCDGDGLGSVLAFYHAFKKINKPVRAITVDKVSQKYKFLSPKKYTENFEELKTTIEPTEIALIFDTNDYRRVQPLYEKLKKHCQEIIYIDHHPILDTGPKPSPYSIVDTAAASTCEIAYFLLKEMGISMDTNIATALYVGIVFDTQRFHFIRNSEISHKICADLCQYIKNNESIYTHLFGMISLKKMNLLSQTINQTEYFYKNQVAVLEITKEKLNKNNLDVEDACDFLDMALDVNSTQLSVLIVHLSKDQYKLSFRSKKWDVSKLAEVFNGGGHKKASGANLVNYKKNPKLEILKAIQPFTQQ